MPFYDSGNIACDISGNHDKSTLRSGAVAQSMESIDRSDSSYACAGDPQTDLNRGIVLKFRKFTGQVRAFMLC